MAVSGGPQTGGSKPLDILVLGVGEKPQVRTLADQLVPWLAERTRIVGVDLERNDDLSEVKADMAVVLGGDGAMLRAARQMGYNQIPVLGVNMGKLGFLAELSAEEFPEQFDIILRGGYDVTRHLVLECGLPTEDGRDETHLVFK